MSNEVLTYLNVKEYSHLVKFEWALQSLAEQTRKPDMIRVLYYNETEFKGDFKKWREILGDIPINVILTRKDTSLKEAFSRLVEKSRGNVIMFIDYNSTYHKNRIYKIMKGFENNKLKIKSLKTVYQEDTFFTTIGSSIGDILYKPQIDSIYKYAITLDYLKELLELDSMNAVEKEVSRSCYIHINEDLYEEGNCNSILNKNNDNL